MKVKLLYVSAVSTLAVALLQAPAGAVEEQWLPTLRNSDVISGAPAVEGTILDPAGKPIDQGTQVVLFANPRPETLASLSVGESYEPTPIAKATVRSGGEYALKVAPEIDLTRFASDEGSVDVFVTAVDHREIATSYLTVDIADLQDATGPSAEIDAKAQLGGEALAEVNPVNPESSSKTDVCGETLVQNLGAQATIVGKSFTTASGSEQQLTISSGSSSKLGVGLSVTGNYGTYSASGTQERDSEISVNMGTRSGFYKYKGWFNYGKYSRWCAPVYDTNQKDVYGYAVRPISGTSINGAEAIALDSADNATYCANMGSGVELTKSDTVATTFAGGVNTSGDIGLSLSAQTGYTSNQKLRSKNTGTGKKQLCGTDGPYSGSPGLVRIKAL